MAYNVIFTVSGAGSDTGPFNISGTTNLGVTTLIQSGIAKSTLEAGYEITIPDDTITGGTVASTGTCTTSQSWTKPQGFVTLDVYATDTNAIRQNLTLYYTVNGGGSINLVTSSQLPSPCGLIGSITGLSRFDQVVFTTVGGYVMSGTSNSTSCPTPGGGSASYTYSVTATSGTRSVALGLDSGAPV